VFTAEGGEVLRDGPQDPIRVAMCQMAGVFAQLDRRIMVKRMREGIRPKAETGRKPLAADPFGYQGTGRGRERGSIVRAIATAAAVRNVALREMRGWE